jgi:hypothetical protein
VGCYTLGNLCKGLVAPLCNHTSVVWYGALQIPHGWVQSSSEFLRDLWWKCTISAECKTNRLAVLTVKSGLDPHMIIKLEDGLKSCSLVMLAIFLWCILPLCLLWVGIYLYFISNQVLIKLDQLKVLNAYSPVHYKAFSFIHSPHLLSTTCAHPCYKQCCSERGCYSEVLWICCWS